MSDNSADNASIEATQGKVRVEVWDLPVRLFHWLLVPCIAAGWLTGETGLLALHEAIGVATIVLIVFRVIWGFVGGEHARFASFLRRPAAVRAYLIRLLRFDVPKDLGHNPLGGWSVLAMLLVILVQVALGLFGVEGSDYQGPLSGLVSVGTSSFLTDLHEALFNVILILVIVHVGAIVLYLVVFRKNLVTPMIGGSSMVDPTTAPGRARPGRHWLAALSLGASAILVLWVVYFL